MSGKSFTVKVGIVVGMASSALFLGDMAVAQEAANTAPPAVTAGEAQSATTTPPAEAAAETAAETPLAPSPAETACFSGPAKLSELEVQAFLSAPAGLLTDFPSGGLPLSTRVRSLAGSDAATLDPILGLVPNASSMQVAAIGSGLARVAKACEKSNPEYAATIQEKIALLGDGALELAFATALNEVQTAALGQAGGAGAGAGGAAGIGGTGTAGGGANGVNGTSASTVTQSGTFAVNNAGSTFGDVIEDVSPTN
ncbi:hypothetical protein [Pararhizobium antarcticum]|uniref:Sugar transporter n=1 Tax=Pararhizobium antarcticum TaxID=1798805 RepID=A0A657LQK8_9HYPH|nr:hypothetical protein [Pararhizobium antarcticum]OJF95282.1 hypothetical protein AX760_19635 [Pararhizobium antarcticum]OJF96354.1 hypothetical protein AX761_15900 [Rhizobium sp. 58]